MRVSLSFAASTRRSILARPSCRRSLLPVVCSLDYVAGQLDHGILKKAGQEKLDPKDILNVFGYPRDFSEKFKLGKVLGCGAFGVVHECFEVLGGGRYAVKKVGKVPGKGYATPRYLLKLRSEVEIMQQLGYSLDAVNLKDVFEDDGSVYMIMELCEGGELFDRIGKTETNTEKYIASLVRGMLRFISQCHTKGFIYRDVKPENFLFVTDAADSPLKATDFGLAIPHTPDEPKLTSCTGTPCYMSPELVRGNYDEKCDLWSVGMLTYQMLTGKLPFWEDVSACTLPEVWTGILKNDINWKSKDLEHLSPPAIDFMKSLLNSNPSRRPTAPAALEHPWVCQQGVALDMPLNGTVVQRLQRFSTYGRLKQMVYKIVFEQMRVEREAKGASSEREAFIHNVQDLFESLDSDNSGSVTMDELQDGLKSQGYELTESEVQQLGAKADHNSNSEIELNELMITMVDWSIVQKDRSWKIYLDRAFKKIDVDGSGFITLDEIVAMMKEQGVAADSYDELLDEAKKMMREVDSNGDGKISRREFDRMMQGCTTQDSLSLYDDRLRPGMKTEDSNLIGSVLL